jgi:hypothetical protein
LLPLATARRDDQGQFVDTGRAVARLTQETRVLPDRDGCHGYLEGIEGNDVRGTLVFLASIIPHRELARRDANEFRERFPHERMSEHYQIRLD